jgi:DNA-binding transcriptional LysR family regulator
MNLTDGVLYEQDAGSARQIELRHLRYFVAVAEELSFTKGAKKLRLAQPSLTRQVRNLENEIGVRLLERANNRVNLTEGGRAFLFDVKKMLAMYVENVAAVQRMHREENVRLNIGYVANLHCSLLPATLAAFRKLYPGVAVNLFDMGSAEQLQTLESRKLDLGFVGLFPALYGPDLVSECVTYDTIVAALPARHPLADKPAIRISDLASQFFVCMSAKNLPGSREWLVKTCRSAGFAASVLQEVDSKEAAMTFVAHGLGVTLVPEQVAVSSQEGVVFRGLSPSLRRESVIAWRADNNSKPLKDYIQIVMDLSNARDPRKESAATGASSPARH